MTKKNKTPTEIRLSIEHANNAIEYYLNNAMLKMEVDVLSVEWMPMDRQFTIVLKELPSPDA